MRTMTVLAVIRVPDDYDIGEDAGDGYERGLSYVVQSPFAIVDEGVHSALQAWGANPAMWPEDSPEGASA